MQLHGVLMILLMSLCTAHGLQCYECVGTDPKTCTNIVTCPSGLDRCGSVSVLGLVTKSCLTSAACISPITCCDQDLCNGAVPPGPGAVLLLVTSAIITLFLWSARKAIGHFCANLEETKV